MHDEKIVIVRWLDAHTTGNEELAPDDIEAELHRPYPMVSVSHLIKSDSAGVSLCGDLELGVDGAVTYRGAHFIPRGMVREEKVIPLPRNVRKFPPKT